MLQIEERPVFWSQVVGRPTEVVDHYAGDLQLLDDLLSLKQRYGSRVHFILGNRPLVLTLFNLVLTSSWKVLSETSG